MNAFARYLSNPPSRRGLWLFTLLYLAMAVCALSLRMWLVLLAAGPLLGLSTLALINRGDEGSDRS